MQTLAYYRFVPLDNPQIEVQRHKKFFKERNVAGRIYFSEEGINGQISGEIGEMEAYKQWLQEDERFSSMPFKMHPVKALIFPRLSIKYRKQLVALDQMVDLANRGELVSSHKWKEMLESGNYLLLDVRNQYEWEIGHFEGALLPPINTFREFPAYADNLNKNKEIMMYCTGGIRCELYSALLKEKGFDRVYQLKGGVITYGQQVGAEHWKGKLFVFDDRLAISIDGKEIDPIAHCSHCHLPCDTYYNCANMDCNTLFICCPACIEVYQGCCQKKCQSAHRRRFYSPERGNKPFRRKHLVEEELASASESQR